MKVISYRNRHFPPTIIQRAVWLYTRFNLSLRDVEELLAERGAQVSYETIRRCVMKFGPEVARRLSCDRARPHPLWHLDEMYVSIVGRLGSIQLAAVGLAGNLMAEVELAVAEELTHFDGVALSVSTSALSAGRVPDTPLIQSILKNYNPSHSGDIYVVFEPNRFINDFDGLRVATTHGSP